MIPPPPRCTTQAHTVRLICARARAAGASVRPREDNVPFRCFSRSIAAAAIAHTSAAAVGLGLQRTASFFTGIDRLRSAPRAVGDGGGEEGGAVPCVHASGEGLRERSLRGVCASSEAKRSSWLASARMRCCSTSDVVRCGSSWARAYNSKSMGDTLSGGFGGGEVRF